MIGQPEVGAARYLAVDLQAQAQGPGQQLEETSRQPLPQPQAGPVTERYRQRHHQGEQRSEQQCGQDRQQPHGEAQSPHTAALKWRA